MSVFSTPSNTANTVAVPVDFPVKQAAEAAIPYTIKEAWARVPEPLSSDEIEAHKQAIIKELKAQNAALVAHY